MIQLEGHLKGRALQESRLERTFRTAYGRDEMSVETKETLLYGKLQEGLRLRLMRAPAVSGARDYQELCMASKNEEKRLANLKKREEYSKPHASAGSSAPRQTNKPRQPTGHSNDHSNSGGSSVLPSADSSRQNMKCFYCNKTGHRKQDCWRRKKDSGETESRGPSRGPGYSAAAKQIRVGEDQPSSDTVSCSPSELTQQTMSSVPASSPPSESVGDESSTPPPVAT